MQRSVLYTVQWQYQDLKGQWDTLEGEQESTIEDEASKIGMGHACKACRTQH